MCPAEPHREARVGRGVDELLGDRARGRHRRRRLEPVLAVVPGQDDDLRAGERPFQVPLDECVRLALVLRHLEGLGELALGRVVLRVREPPLRLALAHPAQQEAADARERDAEQDDQEDGALDRVCVTRGAVRLDQLDQLVVLLLEALDQVVAGGDRDGRDGPSVADPDHGVVGDPGPALGDALLLGDRGGLLEVVPGECAGPVRGCRERGRGLVVGLQEALAPGLGEAAQRALAGEQRAEHRAGRIALRELARADVPFGRCGRPGDARNARNEGDQDRREPEQVNHHGQ